MSAYGVLIEIVHQPSKSFDFDVAGRSNLTLASEQTSGVNPTFISMSRRRGLYFHLENQLPIMSYSYTVTPLARNFTPFNCVVRFWGESSQRDDSLVYTIAS